MGQSGYTKSTFPAFVLIEGLKCFDIVKQKLLAGVPGSQVARYVHEDMGEGDCYTRRTLTAYLLAYRRRLSAFELVAIRHPEYVNKAMEEIDQGLDEISELAEIYGVQKDRIYIGHKMETKLKVLNKTLGNEVRVAAELLRTSFQIKESLGATGAGRAGSRPGPEMLFNVRARYGEQTARVLSDPSKRTRVIEAARRALSIGDEEEEQDAKVAVIGR